MRSLILATTAAVIAVAPAAAQAPQMGGHRMSMPRPPMAKPMPGRPGGHWTAPRPQMPTRPGGHWTGPRPGGHWQAPRPGATHGRWGGRVNGRWYGGVFAPGGWGAYRQPFVGWVLPTYWYTPSFSVADYARYGLAAPGAGYSWSRYYDDAVLVDRDGRVRDHVRGIDWDRYDDEDDVDVAYDDDRAGPPPHVEVIDTRRERRDDGVGGAVIGGVLGGVAGNVIAGRGNRAAGTLLGAGVGAIAGAAIDRAEDRHHRRYDDRDMPPPPPHGAPYPPPEFVDMPPPHGRDIVMERRHRGAPYPMPHGGDVRVMRGHGPHVVRADGGVTTTVIEGPYGSTTTVTVVPSVTTTTITKEYVAPIVRHRAVHRYTAKTKTCRCR